MSSMLTTKPRKAVAAVAIVAASLSVAACGSSDSGSTKSTSAKSAPKASPPKAVASIDSLTGKDTKVALDKGFTDALASLKLTPGVLGTAKLQAGSLVFPITGGNVTYFKPGTLSPYVIGQVQHEGSGLSLKAGPSTVQITNLNVDPGVSRVYGDVTVNGEVAATSAYLFELNGTTLKPLAVKGNTAVLEGAKVLISDVAAPVLNDVFSTKAVKPGLLVGIAKITVQIK